MSELERSPRTLSTSCRDDGRPDRLEARWADPEGRDGILWTARRAKGPGR